MGEEEQPPPEEIASLPPAVAEDYRHIRAGSIWLSGSWQCDERRCVGARIPLGRPCLPHCREHSKLPVVSCASAERPELLSAVLPHDGTWMSRPPIACCRPPSELTSRPCNPQGTADDFIPPAIPDGTYDQWPLPYCTDIAPQGMLSAFCGCRRAHRALHLTRRMRTCFPSSQPPCAPQTVWAAPTAHAPRWQPRASAPRWRVAG